MDIQQILKSMSNHKNRENTVKFALVEHESKIINVKVRDSEHKARDFNISNLPKLSQGD